MRSILITGGAGFIGSHIAQRLCERGDRVRILDSLLPQVHGDVHRPSYLPHEVELRVGDVSNPEHVLDALDGIDAVIHLAAAVGVGQSMYKMAAYTLANDVGTAVLLEGLARRPVTRLVCASSMSVYGEGLARFPNGDIVEPPSRGLEQLENGRWALELRGETLVPAPTPESKKPVLSSVYALNKYFQEQLCLIFGRTYQVPTVALRLFNVYGPNQSLSNPYTGVLAIFASRLLSRRPPLVFEDGKQKRDFVHVEDVARAFVLALDSEEVVGRTLNIGSGEDRTILSVARDIADIIGRADIEPVITGRYRAGDIRHCFADISAARQTLGYEPEVDFRSGLEQFADWLRSQKAEDYCERATAELEARGLVI